MKILGLISVLALTAALAVAEFRWGPDPRRTFSGLVARKRSSIIYYFVVFFIFLVLFSLFMTMSLVPQFDLPETFTGIYFVGVLSQLVCIAVPERGGCKTRIHLVAAGLMSASALAQILVFTLLARLSTASLAVCVISLLLMASIWLIIIFKHRLIKYELALQSTYFACYLGTLVSVSYVM